MVLIHRIANDRLHFVEYHRSLLCETMSKCFINIEKPRLIHGFDIIKILAPSVDNKLSNGGIRRERERIEILQNIECDCGRSEYD